MSAWDANSRVWRRGESKWVKAAQMKNYNVRARHWSAQAAGNQLFPPPPNCDFQHVSHGCVPLPRSLNTTATVNIYKDSKVQKVLGSVRHLWNAFRVFCVWVPESNGICLRRQQQPLQPKLYRPLWVSIAADTICNIIIKPVGPLQPMLSNSMWQQDPNPPQLQRCLKLVNILLRNSDLQPAGLSVLYKSAVSGWVCTPVVCDHFSLTHTYTQPLAEECPFPGCRLCLQTAQQDRVCGIIKG